MKQKLSCRLHKRWEGTIRVLVEELGAVDSRQVKIGDLCNESVERIGTADVDVPLTP